MLNLLLRTTSVVYFLVGLAHLTLGIGADSLIGADLDAATLSNATLDSQSRFYGTAFGVSGLLLWTAAAKIESSKPIIFCVMLSLFGGGLARLVSIAQIGLPSQFALLLLFTELLVPLLVVFLMRQSKGRVIS
jgi:Domain of unknown function (DUF4345)